MDACARTVFKRTVTVMEQKRYSTVDECSFERNLYKNFNLKEHDYQVFPIFTFEIINFFNNWDAIRWGLGNWVNGVTVLEQKPYDKTLLRKKHFKMFRHMFICVLKESVLNVKWKRLKGNFYRPILTDS